MNGKYGSFSDAELIELYQKTRDAKAARELIDRHYDDVLKMLSSKLGYQQAEDTAQIFWTRFFGNIENYRESGLFSHYLSKAVSNLAKEQWRNQKTRDNHISDLDLETSLEFSQGSETVAGNGTVDAEKSVDDSEAISYLVNKLIPGLPIEQRIVWLLKHESEFWEPKQPLCWSALASLNGISSNHAWELFERARKKLLNTHHRINSQRLEDEEMLMFTVWTQAQRNEKRDNFTMKYFADLLGESENTLKTRYRAATKSLDSALKSQRYSEVG